MTQDKLRVIPLGGLGEIGKNMMALEYGDDIVVVDAGVLFPSEDMLGVDVVIPDISYLLERQERVRAILITHGHEDHIGALPYILPRLHVPVYASRLTHGLISVKLREQHSYRGARLHEMAPGQPFPIGQLEAEFFRVCHSIPDAMGVAIRTPLGLVLHTGDFKIDHTPVDGRLTDFPTLSELASEGVLLLCSDSTYAELPGYTPSETTVGEALVRVVAEAPGRVLVATFASLISRIQQIIHAAAIYNRRVAVVGRSMVNNVKMALEMGYLEDEQGVLATLNEVKGLPQDRVILATTGSQGEPTSALVRMATGNHREVQIVSGDTVVLSASPIPGNQTLITRTIDNLVRQGARVLYERNATVHVHGHASQEELKLVLNMTRPRYFVPVHGEYRNLTAHAQMARSLGAPPEQAFVLEDGDVLELDDGGGTVADRLSLRDVFVDGRRVWESQNGVMQDRRVLSRQGMVVVVVPLDRERMLAGDPRVVSRGFVNAYETPELLEEASVALRRSLEGESVGDRADATEGRIRDLVSRFLFKQTGRRPLVVPVCVET